MLKKTKDKLYGLIEENPGYTLLIMIILVGLLLSDTDMVSKAKSKFSSLV